MPISAQTIVSRMAADLDAEGSDRYTFEQDYKYAINKSIEWCVTAFSRMFADDKFNPEQLRELVKVGIWQASKFSRVAYNPSDTGSELWSVLGVFPKVTVHPSIIVTNITGPEKSRFFPNASFIKSDESCERLTLEQWNRNEKNIFLAGNNVMKNDLASYGYLDFADYSSSSYNNPGTFEITIRPDIPNELVGIAYLAYPKPVSLITDVIQFPSSMLNIITEKALNFISYKQGDGTNLYAVTDKDTQALTSLLM